MRQSNNLVGTREFNITVFPKYEVTSPAAKYFLSVPVAFGINFCGRSGSLIRTEFLLHGLVPLGLQLTRSLVLQSKPSIAIEVFAAVMGVYRISFEIVDTNDDESYGGM